MLEKDILSTFNISALIVLKRKAELTVEEQDYLDLWVNKSDENKALYDSLQNDDVVARDFKELKSYNTSAALQKVNFKINATRPEVTVKKLSAAYYYAAAAVSILLFGIFFYTLSNKDAITPSLANQVAENLIKIEVPAGKYKQIILPDGSKVRLNAASSLSYSRTFDTSDNRIVNLNGEAYFDVVADNNRPFIVRTKLQDVEVLGTKFLVESYNEEPEVKTSLYSGKIKIKRVNAEDVVLSPGQQSLVSSFAFRIIQLSDSDVSKDLERFDYIDFKGETIQQVLRKVARWYDVQIKYDGPVSEYKISGSISKDIELPKVIEMLNILFPNEIIKLKGAVVTVKLRK